MTTLVQQQLNILVRVLVRLALRHGMVKCHLIEIISKSYDTERDNLRSPQ